MDSVKWKKKGKKNAHRPVTEPWQFTAHLRHGEKIKALISEKKQPTLTEKSADTPSARHVLVVFDSQSDCLFKNSPFTKIPQRIFHPLVHSDTVSGRCTKLRGLEKANRVQKGSILDTNIWEVVVWKALDRYSKRALPPSGSFWSPSTDEPYRLFNWEKSSELWMT